ncbi:hypothetical protein CO676_05520 [Sinorhizobium sp. BJ1]|nr:hypothetical protein CO676_05520 [Sinorhizobium sp. BJ1]
MRVAPPTRIGDSRRRDIPDSYPIIRTWINRLARGFSADCAANGKMPAFSLTKEKPCHLGFC